MEMDARLIKALERLFRDPFIHPVVFQSVMPDGKTISGPKVGEQVHRCQHCVGNLFELSQAFFAWRNEKEHPKT